MPEPTRRRGTASTRGPTPPSGRARCGVNSGVASVAKDMGVRAQSVHARSHPSFPDKRGETDVCKRPTLAAGGPSPCSAPRSSWSSWTPRSSGSRFPRSTGPRLLELGPRWVFNAYVWRSAACCCSAAGSRTCSAPGVSSPPGGSVLAGRVAAGRPRDPAADDRGPRRPRRRRGAHRALGAGPCSSLLFGRPKELAKAWRSTARRPPPAARPASSSAASSPNGINWPWVFLINVPLGLGRRWR